MGSCKACRALRDEAMPKSHVSCGHVGAEGWRDDVPLYRSDGWRGHAPGERPAKGGRRKAREAVEVPTPAAVALSVLFESGRMLD